MSDYCVGPNNSRATVARADALSKNDVRSNRHPSVSQPPQRAANGALCLFPNRSGGSRAVFGALYSIRATVILSLTVDVVVIGVWSSPCDSNNSSVQE